MSKLEDTITKYIGESSLKDYGFTVGDEPPISKEVENEIETLKKTLSKLQNTTRQDMEVIRNMVVPLLANLISTSDQDYIYWPNRKVILEEKLKQLIEIIKNHGVTV